MTAIETLIQDLDGDTYTRLHARHQLEIIGEESVPHLIIALEEGGRKAWEAARLLGKWRIENAIPILIKALRGNDPVLGQIAVSCLDHIEGDAMTRIFIDVLFHAHSMTQLDLIAAIERRADARAIPTLCQLLTETESNMIRLSLIQAIGALGNGDEITLITPYLTSEDRHVQKRARIAITRLEARQKSYKDA